MLHVSAKSSSTLRFELVHSVSYTVATCLLDSCTLSRTTLVLAFATTLNRGLPSAGASVLCAGKPQARADGLCGRVFPLLESRCRICTWPSLPNKMYTYRYKVIMIMITLASSTLLLCYGRGRIAQQNFEDPSSEVAALAFRRTLGFTKAWGSVLQHSQLSQPRGSRCLRFRSWDREGGM